VDNINKQIEKRGIRCNRLVLQNIIMDASILKSFENIFVAKKQAQMLQEQERVDHERKMKSLEYNEKETEYQNRLMLSMAKTEADINHLKGFTADHLVKLKEIEALQNVQKVVYLPPGNVQNFNKI